MLSSYAQSVFTTGCIYAIVCIGLYITIASGQFSIAHAAIMGLGAYTAGVVAVQFNWPFWPTLFAAAAVGGIMGAILGFLLRNMHGILVGVATLAIGQIISLGVSNIDFLGGSLGYAGVPLRTNLWSVAVILAVLMAMLTWLRHTRTGLVLVAVGKEPVVAEALGISTLWVRIWAFAVGGVLAGIAGGLLVQFLGIVAPADLSFTAEIPLLVYLIVGGQTTPWGAVVGAIGLTWLLELLRSVGTTSDRFWVLGLILTVVVLVRPQGILVRQNLWARDPGDVWAKSAWRLFDQVRGLRTGQMVSPGEPSQSAIRIGHAAKLSAGKVEGQIAEAHQEQSREWVGVPPSGSERKKGEENRP